jgi:valyl-tRNA synthetase
MLEKTFSPQDIERKLYEQMKQSGVFACKLSSKAKPFTIMMPPPNVTGSLHMGHALNTTLQDVLVRYNRMNGRDALWQPGLDHAGIATQILVERQLEQEGTSRRELGREDFLKRVWDWKAQSGGTIINQMHRLGASPDWARERFTMDEGLSKAVLKVFVQLHKEGLIYRDKRLVNWDPKMLTAISDLEVEQKESKAQMWHIRYPIEGETAEFIIVATTRPETMLGDVAVAVHPDDERYQKYIGKFVVLPIADRLIPVIADEYADPEQGSGAVKITPAHDFNDFEVGKRHNLPMINIFDAKAHLNEHVPDDYQGLERYKARKKILAELEALELLAEVQDITNSVPYSQRSGVVVEPYLTDQWYCDAQTLADPAIKAVESGKIQFVPKGWENTYFEWMRNIQPWCISRQLWWGHQIPAWYGPDKHVFVAESEDEAYKLADSHYGESVTLVRDEDVLDTWFSSALWPFSTLGWPDQTPEVARYYPGDVLITGFDIIFFWVARMIMMGMHFMDDVPFHTVYMHALVRDAQGQKMSKSKGNVMDPLELIDKYGADALRFTLTAMAAQGRDIKLSEERVEGYRNFATKLWNATRYCEMNGCLPSPGFDPAAVTYIPNQWIISALATMKSDLDTAIAEYRFNEAAMCVYQFVWGAFCDWYLEFTKPVLAENNAVSDEIRKTTGWVLDQILLILNPFMPFITEELFAAIAERSDGQMLCASVWPKYEAGLIKPQADQEMNWLTRFITEIRSVRADMNVPAGAKIKLVVKDASVTTKKRLADYNDILTRMARLESVDHVTDIPQGSIQTIVDEATLGLPIADIIDLDKERSRLEKEIQKLEQDIKKIEQQLGNQKFVENAPREIVEEQKSRKSEAEQAREKLSQALKQLAAA